MQLQTYMTAVKAADTAVILVAQKLYKQVDIVKTRRHAATITIHQRIDNLYFLINELFCNSLVTLLCIAYPTMHQLISHIFMVQHKHSTFYWVHKCIEIDCRINHVILKRVLVNLSAS